MTTEQVLFKADKNFLKDVDAAVKAGNYQSRTEFIRESLRKNVEDMMLKGAFMDRLAGMSKEELIAEFMKFKGKSKVKTTDADNLKTKWQVSKELEEELERRFRPR
jgi:Arc/MetJ-type ribon-helix-helix transcriptional regulator